MPAVDISTIIFTLNDQNNIKKLLEGIKNTFNKKNTSYEIIVADLGSHDNILGQVKNNAVIIEKSKRDFGEIFKEAIKMARGKYIFTLDGDYKGDIDFLSSMIDLCGKADVVIGSRYVNGSKFETGIFHRVSSKLLNWIYSAGLCLPVIDLSSNFRLYRKDVLDEIEIGSKGTEVLQEVLVKIYSLGYKIAEVPICWKSDRKGVFIRKVKYAIKLFGTFFKFWRMRNSPEWADYDHRAFYSRIPLQRYWQRRRFKLITGFLDKGATLDVGCGSSQIIQRLQNGIGVDITFHKLRFVKNICGRWLVQASVYFLPFKRSTFSNIIFSNVLEHIPYRQKIFEEFFNVLKDKGTLVLATPDYSRHFWLFFEWGYNRVLPEAYAKEHHFKYSIRTLYKILAQNRFKVRRCRYILGSELILKAIKV